MCSTNSASYPQWTVKWAVGKYCAVRAQGLVCLIGAVVCLLAAPRVHSSVSAGKGRPQMRCGIIISCQSTATSETAKRCCCPVLIHENWFWTFEWHFTGINRQWYVENMTLTFDLLNVSSVTSRCYILWQTSRQLFQTWALWGMHVTVTFRLFSSKCHRQLQTYSCRGEHGTYRLADCSRVYDEGCMTMTFV